MSLEQAANKTSINKRNDRVQLVLAKIGRWLVGPDALAVYFFAVMSFVIMWPLSAHLAESQNTEGDNLLQTWTIGWVLHKLPTEPLNLFNANIFYPYPNTLAYTDHLLAQSLLAAPIVLLTGNLVLAYNLMTLLSFILSGWFAYLLVKEISGSRAGGLVAGMVFAYASYKIGRMSQLNLLSTEWIPLCFLFLRRMMLESLARAKDKTSPLKLWSTVGFAAAFVMNGLSSFYYLFYILPLLALYVVLFFGAHRSWPGWGFVAKLAGAAVGAMLFIGPTLLPYLALVNELGAGRTKAEVQQFSANYRFYFATPENNLLWGGWLSRYGGSGGERKLFPGAIALLLTAVAIFGPLVSWLYRKTRRSKILATANKCKRANSETYLWLAVGLLALAMSFGPVLKVRGLDITMPYNFFFDYFPGWSGLRAAMRYGVFVLLAVAVMAGTAVGYLRFTIYDLRKKRVSDVGYQVAGGSELKTQNSKLKTSYSSFILLALLVGMFVEYRSDISYINPGILPNPPQVYRWLGQPQNAGPVIELPQPDPAFGPSIRDYYTTFNWQPLVGGQSGFAPPVYGELKNSMDGFPTPVNVALLQGIKVRWVVWHLNDQNTPLTEEWSKIEQRIAKTPELRLAMDFPQDGIKVYELKPNAWLDEMADKLPAGTDVAVSDYRRTQPIAIELAITWLRQRNHAIFGNDRAGFRFLKASATGQAVPYGLFAGDEDPAPYGFGKGDMMWQGYGLKLYGRKGNQLVAAYNVSQDANLRDFGQIEGKLRLDVSDNEVRFNGRSVGTGSGSRGGGQGQLRLIVGSLEAQTVRITGSQSPKTFEMAAGISEWHLNTTGTVEIEPAAGKKLYLSRVEFLRTASTGDSVKLLDNGPALLVASNRQEGGKLITTLDVLAPQIGNSATDYTLSLDTYLRPWGSHPGGHFGIWSAALKGDQKAHRVEFIFDPARRETLITIDGAGVGVGADVIRPKDGEWATFIALYRKAENQTAPEQMGVARLYEWDLAGNTLQNVNLLPGKGLFFQPPIK